MNNQNGDFSNDPPVSANQSSLSHVNAPLIIGIGASAGGMEAFEAFFSHMPPQSGMAFVVIQHLAPQHQSILADLIQRHTQMSVNQAENDMAIELNTVYVIPPNTQLGIINGKLQLVEPAKDNSIRLPIDYFFRSLADEMHEKAVGIVLSGTGSDGTLGVKAIKGEGGIIIVQDPSSAGYDGMPRSAIATGMADFILTPSKMPDQLVDYSKRLKLGGDGFRPIIQQENPIAEFLSQILLMIRSQTGHDFSHYKQSTILRRVERLMAVNQIEKMSDYIRFLQNNSVGVELLFRDLLIGVTNFFRDKEVFSSLQQSVISYLFQNRRSDQPIRIWVPGCSTGEEAYSIAILVREQMVTLKKEFRVQIFATDLDSQSVNLARIGKYPSNIALDVPTEYLNQYFLTTPEGYEITKPLRELLVFAQHSVTKDPPFSKLDLISCRNLLIYLDSELQDKVLASFQFALAPVGFLLLGSSESLGKHDHEFKTIDAQSKIFQRLPGNSTAGFRLTSPSLLHNMTESDDAIISPTQLKLDLRELVETLLLTDWTPTCVIINHQGHMRYVHGHTGKYLEISSGKIEQLDIIRSAREGLKIPLTTAIYRAITQQIEIYEMGVRIKTNGDEISVNLTVKPLREMLGDDNLLAVFFENISEPDSSVSVDSDANANHVDEREQKFHLLQHELNDTREYLQATIEELKSSNEEMQSTNEELQSVNEELETSQEELKAVNEELLTINTELEQKINEVNLANNDLENTFNTIQTGIILLDVEFQIRRFNPAATRLFRLIVGDLGRPIADVVSDLNYPTLYHDMETVFNSLLPFERDVQTNNGQQWYALQIRPYRTKQNAIKGVVISFNDVTTHKQMEQVQAALVRVESIFDTVREPLLLLDDTLKVINANHAFFQRFNITPKEAIRQPLNQLSHGNWNIPELITRIKSVIQKNTTFQDFEVDYAFSADDSKKLLINARQVQQNPDLPSMVLIAIEDRAISLD